MTIPACLGQTFILEYCIIIVLTGMDLISGSSQLKHNESRQVGVAGLVAQVAQLPRLPVVLAHLHRCCTQAGLS